MVITPRILLADDSPIVHEAVVCVAQERGYEIISALSGRDVHPTAIVLQPELIVLDLTFPDADGRDILARLKADVRTEHIPVLVWSGHNSESDRMVAIGLGAEDYVEKAPAQTLMTKIQRVLFRLEGTSS